MEARGAGEAEKLKLAGGEGLCLPPLVFVYVSFFSYYSVYKRLQKNSICDKPRVSCMHEMINAYMPPLGLTWTANGIRAELRIQIGITTLNLSGIGFVNTNVESSVSRSTPPDVKKLEKSHESRARGPTKGQSDTQYHFALPRQANSLSFKIWRKARWMDNRRVGNFVPFKTVP